jgi:hypothetical protein
MTKPRSFLCGGLRLDESDPSVTDDIWSNSRPSVRSRMSTSA